jgi:hypothetical protein
MQPISQFFQMMGWTLGGVRESILVAAPGTVILLNQAMSVTEEIIVTMVGTSNIAIKVYVMQYSFMFSY